MILRGLCNTGYPDQPEHDKHENTNAHGEIIYVHVESVETEVRPNPSTF